MSWRTRRSTTRSPGWRTVRSCLTGWGMRWTAETAVSSVAVLLIDLDDLKTVNDTLGHLTGDGLLAAIGRRLSSGVRADDTVARLGGDEFAVVLESVGETEAVGLAERILTDVSRPFVLADQEVFTHASVGIALSDGDGVRGEQLLRDADLALYQAKGAGKGRYAVFEP